MTRRAVRRLLVLGVASLQVLPLLAADARTRSLDLRNADVTFAEFGSRTSAAGDVNGDGHSDLLIGHCKEPGADVYVALGTLTRGVLDAASDEHPGFWIRWQAPRENPGFCYPPYPAAAGDVNGDGFDDVLVGIPDAVNSRGDISGVAYVVFGSAEPTDVDLNSFGLGTHGDQGYRIDGAAFHHRLGETVNGAGDINGDGRDDVVVGAPFAASAYVVFGQSSTQPVDLMLFDRNLQGGAGYRIDTARPYSSGHYEVAGVGDVNGDRMPDIAVGVMVSDGGGGRVYVVYGKAGNNLEGHGFHIWGSDHEVAGHSIDGAGDANGDGFSDLVIGTLGGDSAYVVFGKKDQVAVRLRRLRGAGFRIEHKAPTHALSGLAQMWPARETSIETAYPM